MTTFGVARPDGTIVPADDEWSIAGQDGITVIWDATMAPVEFQWNDNIPKWEDHVHTPGEFGASDVSWNDTGLKGSVVLPCADCGQYVGFNVE